MAVIGVFAVNSLTGPSTAGVEGVVSDIITGEGAVDLSSISNEEMEAVVAENPGVVGMRLALARRYFESGDFDKALDHYMVILENDKHPEALANVGWMTYISGRPDVALGYVEAALQRQPDSITATWFLGNIQFTLGNFDEAAEALGTIVDANGVPDDVKESARSLLAQMEEE
jgi:tetratricopeptide (TPR) repeat protein